MTRTFYDHVTIPDQPGSDSEGEAEPNEPSVPMRASVSVEVEDSRGDAVMIAPFGTSADGESNAEGSRFIKKRGTYLKDGPSVYKLIKPVLKAIKEAKARE